MKNSLLLILVSLALLAGGCTKEINPIQKEKSTDLVVPADFSWKTSSKVTVNITGLPLAKDFFSTLSINSADGSKFFTGNFNMKENLVLDLVVPVSVSELILTYGKRTIKASVVNGIADFSFVQKDDQSDLGK